MLVIKKASGRDQSTRRERRLTRRKKTALVLRLSLSWSCQHMESGEKRCRRRSKGRSEAARSRTLTAINLVGRGMIAQELERRESVTRFSAGRNRGPAGVPRQRSFSTGSKGVGHRGKKFVRRALSRKKPASCGTAKPEVPARQYAGSSPRESD